MSKASAPGKVILFGEHAVVYGQPALAVPVTQVQAEVRVEKIFSPGIRINAPNIQLSEKLDALAPSHPLAATVRNTLTALEAPTLSGVTVLVRSTIPVASGLGSGAAVSVAIIRALAKYLKKDLTDEQVSALAFKTEKRDGALHCTYEVAIKNHMIPAEDYEGYYEVNKKLRELADSWVVCQVDGTLASRAAQG